MFEPSLVHESVTTLSPFRYWCQKVLPLVYDNSLSYYELLCKVVEYLNETMENVNTIGENTNALYNAYIELVNYVNAYFNNLDVQNEINNKLDVMAESGELASILSMTIPRKILIISDSYGTNNGGGVIIEKPYPVLVQEYLQNEVDVYYNCQNGAGFCNGRFLNLLNGAVINNPEYLTDIYVCGGWNDESGRNGQTKEQLYEAMTTFKNRAKTLYPKAKLHLCFISWANDGVYATLIETFNWYKEAQKYGFCFHQNIAYVMHDYSLFKNDNIHPNQNGMNELAEHLYNIIQTGNTNVIKTKIDSELKLEPNENVTSARPNIFSNISEWIYNGVSGISFVTPQNGTNFTFDTPETIVAGNQYEFASFTPEYLVPYAYNLFCNTNISLIQDDNNVETVPANLLIKDNKLIIQPLYIVTDTDFTRKVWNNVKIIMINNCSLTNRNFI